MIGNMYDVYAETCAKAGYTIPAGNGTMEDPDADFKGNPIHYKKFVKQTPQIIILV